MEDGSDRFSLLILDDEPQMRKLLGSLFSETEYNQLFASNGREALRMASEARIDAALVDLVMPEMNGMEVLKEIRVHHPETMVVMMTGQGGIKDAVEAIKLGAVDFLEKPFSPEALQARIGQLHRIWVLNCENRQLKMRLEQRFDYSALVGDSNGMLKLKEMIVQVAPTENTILIQGETGTGKELVARAIHRHSRRRQGPFVPVDCGAISQTVMESELFGHVKGAFTGAQTSTLGLIRSAAGGTLFLDEIGDLPIPIQVKFLRTLQEREVRPVGDSRIHPVDVRILAATHRNLSEEVQQGRFREDLFFRINVLTLHIPPLRDRAGDVELLSKHFLQRLSSTTSPVQEISQGALHALEGYAWPGNVRELENTIRRVLALGRSTVVELWDLPEPICPGQQVNERRQAGVVGETIEAFEISAIRNALDKCGGNRKCAARLLGIGEATLYRKIKKYQAAP
jgi:DNA-binding NtrC family response regulator